LNGWCVRAVLALGYLAVERLHRSERARMSAK
jgi:hypothetical protein